jgi:DNA helicase-2/ATP-dependent DNA helicase PcrA
VDILADLNKEQREAVTWGEGPLLVLAGAGSGKTRALTHRVAWLISEGKVRPEEILLLTFTNKAAGEMMGRVRELVGAKPTFGGTFHSFCARVLRIDGGRVGIGKDYIIYDEDDQLAVVKQVMGELGMNMKEVKPRAILGMISQAKNELLTPAEYAELVYGKYQKKAAEVYPRYQRRLRESGAVDFDDLLTETVRLLKKDEGVISKYQRRFKYVLVDEYQDTNKAQYELTKLLCGGWGNLMVVGDFSQSIYSWRGADFRNLNNLKKDFPELKVVNLERNYRSTQKILDGANAVVRRNREHPVLKLWTDKPRGEAIEVYEARSELEEARHVVEVVRNEMGGNGMVPGDFAVLYRTNAQSRVLEEAMLHAGLPYVLVGGVRFYQRREVKDVVSYLRLMANPADQVSQERIVKLGKRRWERFRQWKEELDPEGKTTLGLMDEGLKAAGYLEKFDMEDEEDLARLENIKELRSVAERFPKLIEFLENVALVEQEAVKSLDGEKKAVTLMTLHAAKGLEFRWVFMVGMEEGLFPHSRSMLDKSKLEEERRLCYVWMTRAEEKLILTHARRRLYFGTRGANRVSRFVEEIPEELTVRVNGSSDGFGGIDLNLDEIDWDGEMDWISEL